jgi:hypothetical protein
VQRVYIIRLSQATNLRSPKISPNSLSAVSIGNNRDGTHSATFVVV